MQKIMLALPESLLQSINRVVAKLHSNRSQFIRQAVAEKIERAKKAEFEALMAEGYRVMAKENLQDAQSYLTSLDELEQE